MTDHWYLPKNETAAGLPDQATRRLNDYPGDYIRLGEDSPGAGRGLHEFPHPLSWTGGLTNKGRDGLRGRIIVLGRPQLLLRVFPIILARPTLHARLRCRNPVAYHVFGEARQTKMSEPSVRLFISQTPVWE